MIGVHRLKQKMLQEQLVARGINDPAVLAAMEAVPRHLFVEEALRANAYEGHPLPIGFGQTISHPFVVGLMSQLLCASEGMSVLEIGTGSGYQAAVLAEMGLQVYSIERIRELHLRAERLLRDLKYRRIRLLFADGTLGWPEASPFDRIIVTAGGPVVPKPLVEQLADPGMLVIPVGASKRSQVLTLVHKKSGRVTQEPCFNVSFVDLVGNYGW